MALNLASEQGEPGVDRRCLIIYKRDQGRNGCAVMPRCNRDDDGESK